MRVGEKESGLLKAGPKEIGGVSSSKLSGAGRVFMGRGSSEAGWGLP